MRWIPRLLAGTCVVVAAALTAAPVTAGLADLVLNPGPQTAKRGAQPALTSQRPPSPPTTARGEESSAGAAAEDGRSGNEDTDVVAGTIVADATADTAAGAAARAGATGTEAASTELVAATADAARARVTDLAADLQAGVDAGEFTQADADRVLDDIAGYIHGDRTWPERLSA